MGAAEPGRQNLAGGTDHRSSCRLPLQSQANRSLARELVAEPGLDAYAG